jgi:hypothetical protein
MNRLARTLGVLGLAGAVALTACHDDHVTEQAPSTTKLSETPGAPATATPPAAPGAPAAPSADAAAGGLVWKDMKRDEREHYMKTVVVPTMKPLFAKWSPDEHGDTRCATCHGASAKDKTFKMPNPKLPRLPTDEAGWKELEAKEPEAVKFMREVVVPTMAQMLGEKPYDPATKEGFGCFECHTAKK